MTRHIIDRESLRDSGLRLREFLRIDREAGRHPAVVRLHATQRHAEDAGARLAHYLRIERGRTA
jgi:hypothetical protein